MILNNVDLNKIRVFHSVIENGTYQAAGDDLGLTRSAISQSISTLETQLGIKLFLRKGRKLFPTTEAKKLSSEFGRYQRSLHEVLLKVKNEDVVEGLIRIGSYMEFAKSHLTNDIATFKQKYPKCLFQLVFDTPSRLHTYLESGTIDMAFSIYPQNHSNQFISKVVLNQDFVLVAPKALTFSDDYCELQSVPIVDYYKSHQMFEKWYRLHFQAPCINQPSIFAGSAEMVLELVTSGAGIGVVPVDILKPLHLEVLSPVVPTRKCLKGSIWLNQFKDQFQNRAHRQFYNYITRDNN